MPQKQYLQWILSGKTPTPVTDVREWADWFERHWDERVVAVDKVGETRMSTVFLATDYDFTGAGIPVLFETMLFGGDYDGQQWRWRSWEEAERGHRRIRSALKRGGPLPPRVA